MCVYLLLYLIYSYQQRYTMFLWMKRCKAERKAITKNKMYFGICIGLVTFLLCHRFVELVIFFFHLFVSVCIGVKVIHLINDAAIVLPYLVMVQ